MSELDQYGPHFKWDAATTWDGADVEACPDSNGSITAPAKVRFAG